MIRVLSLCSGVGWLELAIRLALQGTVVVAYAEADEWKRARLHARMRDGWLDTAPVFADLDLAGDLFTPGGEGIEADMIACGYPCPWASGAARGENVEPSLWPRVLERIERARPRYVFLENVVRDPEAIGALERLGYDVGSREVSAAEVGGPHVRARVFALGCDTHAEGEPARALHDALAELPQPGPADRGPWDDPRGDVRMAAGGAYGMAESQAAGDGVCILAAAHALRSLVRGAAGRQLTAAVAS